MFTADVKLKQCVCFSVFQSVPLNQCVNQCVEIGVFKSVCLNQCI